MAPIPNELQEGISMTVRQNEYLYATYLFHSEVLYGGNHIRLPNRNYMLNGHAVDFFL